MDIKVLNKNQKSLTVENLNIKLFFQAEFINGRSGGLPLHTQLHNHSYVEIFACISGGITINTVGKGYELFAGDIAIVPSAVAHFKSSETLTGSEWVTFGFICREVICEHNSDLYSFFDGFMQYDSVLIYRNVGSLCSVLRNCHLHKDENEVSTLLLLLAELIKLPKAEKMAGDNTDVNTRKSKNIDRLLKLDDIINTNYHRNFSNKEIADFLFISERQLSRIVAKNYTEPLRTIILRKRLEIAAELLITTRDSIEHITVSVGFKNKNSFNREFKKRFGVTPSAYRKRNNPQ